MTKETTREVKLEKDYVRPPMDQLRIFVTQYDENDHIDKMVAQIAAHVIGNLGACLHEDIKEKKEQGAKTYTGYDAWLIAVREVSLILDKLKEGLKTTGKEESKND